MYAPATPLPAALVAAAEALLAAEEAPDDADEAALLAAPDADVAKEEILELALLATELSAELTLA